MLHTRVRDANRDEQTLAHQRPLPPPHHQFTSVWRTRSFRYQHTSSSPPHHAIILLFAVQHVHVYLPDPVDPKRTTALKSNHQHRIHSYDAQPIAMCSRLNGMLQLLTLSVVYVPWIQPVYPFASRPYRSDSACTYTLRSDQYCNSKGETF